MNIALLGYGKMGKAIEELAMERGHIIIATIDNIVDWQEKRDRLLKADVAIDFSTPDSIITNIENCVDLKLPLVVGTTGWHNSIDDIKKIILSKDLAFMWASNFSIGVNIFFKLNKELAKLMNNYDDYNVRINEVHHAAKLDMPSGTA
ncbi:MAG: 4-hydroxy-tetrahydrodipicolinate reductase, partial [Bacteroidales bacterium]|nr:4-hydroxy-tetrahydrodipicolinate reductase [Bacteroidales bacterium]